MSCCLFTLVFNQSAVSNRSLITERLIKFYNEIVLEVIRNSTAVTGGISDYLILLRNDLNIRAFIKSIYYNIRILVLWESETEQNGTLCGRKLRHNIVLGKIHLIIIR